MAICLKSAFHLKPPLDLPLPIIEKQSTWRNDEKQIGRRKSKSSENERTFSIYGMVKLCVDTTLDPDTLITTTCVPISERLRNEHEPAAGCAVKSSCKHWQHDDENTQRESCDQDTRQLTIMLPGKLRQWPHGLPAPLQRCGRNQVLKESLC